MFVGVIFWALVLGGLVSCAIGLMLRKNHKTEALQKQEQQRRRRMDLKELDRALFDWLGMLELPQLGNKRKRLVIARQLSTVLIEKLWLSPCPHRSPISSEKG